MGPIVPRQVHFDWEQTPRHWVPGEPYATHLLNACHLLLPAGERWFVHVFRQALPYLHDDALRQQAKGFMGQEEVHARAHATALEHLRGQGFNPTPFLEQLDWVFDHLLGDNAVPPSRRKAWLLERLALIAAIEHFTAVLGAWILTAQGFDDAGADPSMLELLRWHGAEEVEHRCVAFDVFQHLDGSYLRRSRAMLRVFPMLLTFLFRGARLLIEQDSHAGGIRPGWASYRRAAAKNLAPGMVTLLGLVPRYLRRDFHPSKEGSTARAFAYLAESPAARAATARQARPISPS